MLGINFICSSLVIWGANCFIWIMIHPFTFMMSEENVKPINIFHKIMLVLSIISLVVGIILKIKGI